MLAVLFEVFPLESGTAEYLQLAAQLRNFLENRPGFLTIERFESLNTKGKILSLSFWESEESIAEWRNLVEHRHAQFQGRHRLFASYRIRVAQVIREYSDTMREQAPSDSNQAFG